jgi:hypothetical protein
MLNWTRDSSVLVCSLPITRWALVVNGRVDSFSAGDGPKDENIQDLNVFIIEHTLILVFTFYLQGDVVSLSLTGGGTHNLNPRTQYSVLSPRTQAMGHEMHTYLY